MEGPTAVIVREAGLYIPPLPVPPDLASKEVTAVYDRVLQPHVVRFATEHNH